MQCHRDINRRICSHFVSIGLIPEQRQKVRPVTFLTTESHRGLGVETGLDSTWATSWLNVHHNVCVPERHRGAWWSTAFHEEWPLEPNQSTHCCLPMPVFSGLIQAVGGERWDEHVCELEERCGTEHVWAHRAQDGSGRWAVWTAHSKLLQAKIVPLPTHLA